MKKSQRCLRPFWTFDEDQGVDATKLFTGFGLNKLARLTLANTPTLP